MSMKRKLLLLLMLAMTAAFPALAPAKNHAKKAAAKVETTESLPGVLWRDPADVRSRNLFYGPGGKAHEPRGGFTFVKEDMDGSNPKFDVVDDTGMKWKVKLGDEARPETVATRLMWAVGYSANEDYYLEDFRAQDMPVSLRRGQKLMAPDGSFHAVRLKRQPKDLKKVGTWQWRRDPFSGSRELNGLRVVMALINNWDLKDENNAIYEEKQPDGARNREMIYMVSDVGSSFGTAGPDWPHSKAKGNLRSYAASKFITRITPEYVDFHEPARPSYQFLLNLPEYFRRRGLRWIGRDIPRADARWIGVLMAQLSAEQIRDAFRAAGYTPEEVDGFTAVVRERIAALAAL